MILGIASVWEKRKGFDDFIELSHLLDDNYRIVLVGLNDKQMKMLPRNVIGIKRMNSAEELAEIYSMADVFVNTSKEETMGLTSVEAVSCGTPAIVYNRTALPEFITAYNGSVCESIDADGLYSVILKFQRNDYKGIRESALQYDKCRKYKEYIQLY